MPLIVHLTSLLLQILLFCPETDGGSITWFEPPPIETTADNTVIRTYSTSHLEGSTNVELNWNFSLTQDLVFGSLRLELGSNLIATVISSGQYDISVSFRGRVNVRWIPQKVSLTILKVSTQDNGEFSCVVNTIGGGSKDWSRKIKVTVVAPANLTNVTQDQTVLEGSDVQLVCKASGSPVPTITWVQVFQDGSVSEVQHTGPSWNFTDITYAKRGTYRCTAANGIGSSVSRKITLNVFFPATITLPSTSYMYVGREQNASLECQVKGYPPPTITWIPCNSQEVCNTRFLNILKVERSANYSCAANNSLGHDSAIISLVIGGKNIYQRLMITNKDCRENKYDESFWKILEDEVEKIFRNKKGYAGTELLKVSCGSLIVDLVLKFGTNVAEDWALATFREAAKDGTLGELMVNVSSIVGIPSVIKSTDTSPTTTPTPESDASNIVLIVGLVVGAVVMPAIIVAAILLWRTTKCCNCCAKDTNKVSHDEATGPQNKPE